MYPVFADSVTLYSVGSDPFESLGQLVTDHASNDYPGTVAVPYGRMLRDLNVLTQSTKIAIDSTGVITYRAGYGRGNPGEWSRVFENLAATSSQ